MQNFTSKLIIFLLGLLFVLALFDSINSARAYTVEKYDDAVEGRFVVSPGKLDYKLNPGDSINAEVLVVNRLGEKKDFFVKKEMIGDQNDLVMKEVIDNWFVPELDKFTLDQGERIKFNVAIKIPSDAKSSGYYASILIGTKGEQSNGKDQVDLVSQIGLPLFVTVEGQNILKQGNILSFIADKFFYRIGPVKFDTVFENQGNVHLQPRAEVSVYNFLGSKIAQLPVKPWIVMPKSSEKQTIIWNRKWLMGRYRANEVVFFGDNQQLERSYVFYAFPWHIALLIILALIIIHELIKYWRSKYEIKFHAKEVGKIKGNDSGVQLGAACDLNGQNNNDSKKLKSSSKKKEK